MSKNSFLARAGNFKLDDTPKSATTPAAPSGTPAPTPPAGTAADADSTRPPPAPGPLRPTRSTRYPVVDMMVESEEAERKDAKIAQLESDLANANTRVIALDRVRPNPHQPRLVMDGAKLDLLMASLRESGQLQPILVRPDSAEEGYFLLVSGGRRCEALRRLGETTVSAEVRSMTVAEAAIASMAENVARDDLSDYEMYKEWATWIADRIVASKSEIAARLGIDRTVVVRMFAFEHLPPAVLAILDQKPDLLGYNAAQQLKTWHEEGHTTLVVDAVQKLADNTLTNMLAALDWIRKRLRGPAAPVARSFENRAGRPVFALSHAPRQLTVKLASGIPPTALKSVMARIEAVLQEAAQADHDAS